MTIYKEYIIREEVWMVDSMTSDDTELIIRTWRDLWRRGNGGWTLKDLAGLWGQLAWV